MNAIEESTSTMQKMVAKTAETTVFDAYNNVVQKRLEALGQEKATIAFGKILIVLNEMNNSD